MKQLRVVVPGLHTGRLPLDKQALHYVRHVHRLGLGQSFIAIDPQRGVQARATVVDVSRYRVECEIDQVTKAVTEREHQLWLLVGMCAQDRFSWAIREATALGVTHIIPVIFARSVSVGKTTTQSRTSRWAKILAEGARQSLRSDVPVLHEVMSLQQAIESVADHARLLCLYARAQRSIATEVYDILSQNQHVALLVGPEGGMQSSELQLVQAAGATLVSISANVLRTETAVIAALGTWASICIQIGPCRVAKQ